MIIKKYVANTVEEAQELVRQELGPAASILTSRYIKQKGIRALFAPDKVEVTAAIDEETLRKHTDAKMPSGQEVKAEANELDENLARLKQLLATVDQKQEPQIEPAMALAGEGSSSATTYGDPRYSRGARKPTTTTSYPSTMGSASTASTGGGDSFVRSTPPPERSNPSPSEPDHTDVSLARRKLNALRQASRRQQERTVSTSERSKLEEASRGLVEAFQSKAPSEEERLRSMIREELSHSTVTPASSEEEVGSTAQFLVGKGVDGAIAKKIEQQLDVDYGDVDLSTPSRDRTRKLNALKRKLSDLVMTTGPILLRHGRCTCVALVGPTGVGKTTTIAKLAAQYRNELGKRVALISLDTTKVGAGEQIRGLAQQLGVPVTIVNNGRELRDAVATFDSYDLCLIDTHGCSQYLRQTVDGLADTLATLDEVEVLLVVSAATKDLDIYGTVESFKPLQPNGAIVTKMDETIAQGVLVNICAKTGMSLSYLTSGQNISDLPAVADPDTIARGILVQNNALEYQRLRRMVR